MAEGAAYEQADEGADQYGTGGLIISPLGWSHEDSTETRPESDTKERHTLFYSGVYSLDLVSGSLSSFISRGLPSAEWTITRCRAPGIGGSPPSSGS
jgi:hypothetical protein